MVFRLSEESWNTAVSYGSGFLFGVGWWLFIDGVAYGNHVDAETKIEFVHSLPGVFATIATLIINVIPTNVLEGSSNMFDMSSNPVLKFFLFFGFAMLFSGPVGSACVYGIHFAGSKVTEWPGIALLLQSIFVTIAALLFKFGRKEVETNFI